MSPRTGAPATDATAAGRVFQLTDVSSQVAFVVDTRSGAASPLTPLRVRDSAAMRRPCHGERLKRRKVSALARRARWVVAVP